MKYFIAFLLLAFTQLANSEAIPPNAKQHIPALNKAIKDMGFPKQYKASIAGQIEQETCISLKHKKCWSSKVELRTAREYGFGLGQATIAYNKDGTERFNVFKELKQSSPLFKGWTWEDRFNAEYQIKGIIFKDQKAYAAIKFPMADEYEKMATMFAMYNGGVGSILKDRALCRATKGCNDKVWFGGIELTSYKSRIAVKGYGKSFYDINREYPRNILKIRMQKYYAYVN